MKFPLSFPKKITRGLGSVENKTTMKLYFSWTPNALVSRKLPAESTEELRRIVYVRAHKFIDQTLSAPMEESCNRSILDYVCSKEKSDLCRFLFYGVTSRSGEEVLKTLGEFAREYFGDRVTGLMLVYANYIIHLLESDEDEIFRVCSYLVNLEPRVLAIAKYFPMEVGVQERFFEKWYGRRVTEDFGAEGTENELGMSDLENFEQVTNTYRGLSRDLFSLFEELRQARKTSRACLMERLEEIGSVGDPRLPTRKTLGALVASSWGEDLGNLLNNYRSEVRSREIDDDVWPFPDRRCTSLETIGNT